MHLTLAGAVGLAATLLAVGYTVPQFRRLRRMGSAEGVSVAALACSTVSGAAWTAYGVWEGDPWIALPAAVTVPATVGALVLAWRRGGSRERLWLPAVWTAVVALAGLSVPWAGAGLVTVVLGCSVALLVTPAALTAWRSPDVSAVAASGWVMLVLDALLAAAYGVLADVEANLIYAAVATAGSLAVLARLHLPPHVHARLVRLPAGPTAEVSPEVLDLVA
ncbi:SemiSWEET family transporter [Nocardioides sp. SYSU DS0663]|uniref:SemiSWEET family transporter n=1 Tax=Nocardioides sp. SYSU DS0663 TaxID=3416445 RepID=UPI003F4AFCE7